MAEHIPWFCHRPSHPQKFIQTSPDTARIPRDINILEGGANRREKGPEPWNCCGCAEHQLQNPKRIHRPMGAQVCSAPLKGKICPAPMEVHHMASLCLQILSTFKQWVALEGLMGALEVPFESPETVLPRCIDTKASISTECKAAALCSAIVLSPVCLSLCHSLHSPDATKEWLPVHLTLRHAAPGSANTTFPQQKIVTVFA
mmetsp:Transcript_25359/g.40187  ORF Transcript_25359/g.40187 Transcript_25359/m.40187 type:complete len:202 (+) Transcript_25359:1454-2059(+)|eukprot:CAMPEP_0174382884 /NCGR_PEP_ID=MMETSP0811_2-20130205/124866_1 /TAXON_ID=73025 ORGANISM="Eutreptiella gymnastica-like, Strain CCMP1594" /NCGR_SAMPLE_ID=MMETSP0811_2 /ASSEMBLY_ACC=CAM_ASM_000667 /LENGTH=201 /DNA_ID=CAMNT_0015536293 /DNA_START=1500 /DNA_END=2105 /DNA_ORIENTATION=+